MPHGTDTSTEHSSVRYLLIVNLQVNLFFFCNVIHTRNEQFRNLYLHMFL